MSSPRRHQAYWAFVGHRVSGLLLALFLPVHFWALGLALEGAERLDRFLRLADIPAFKFGEWALVVLLSVHLCFGLRLLALELLPWKSRHDARLGWIAWGGALSLAVGAVFLVRVID